MVNKAHPEGYPFTKDTVTAMLTNPFYTGVVTFYGEGVRDEAGDPVGLHEAIIDRALFDWVQALRAAKGGQGRKGSTQGQAYTYLATGLAHCACCHQPLRAQGSATPEARLPRCRRGPWPRLRDPTQEYLRGDCSLRFGRGGAGLASPH
jgi:cytochrome c553